ncbi:MAG: GAF domain-containing sensor histidine kinase [Chloroflexi bacterium]|nr:MAG: GAF domain-containing sensor histidine kinase [Chloroflexota bacterium]TMG35782.1 MAG: GAF domain-containing sensor histidine kinase [Chloroflexota bacterium]
MPPSEAQQLETLLELQRDVALEANIDRVLERIAATAKAMLDADRATLYVVDQGRNEIWSRVLTEGEVPEGVEPVREIRLPLDGRSLAAEVARTGHVLRIDDPYDDPRFDPSVDARTGYRTRSILVVPIESRDRRRIGVLQAVNHHDGPFRAEDERYAQALATEADIALEYVQLSGDLAVERLRVVKVAEEERHRLARDLHDGVAQTLANAALGIELAQRRARQDLGAALADLEQLRGRLVESQKGLRDILFALRPLALEEGGLGPAVRALADRINGTNGSSVVARRIDAKRRLAPEVEAGAFTVIREAANNAIKTGRAPHVSLDVYEDAGAVVALVEDDGRGFDVASTLATYADRGSLGLLQMRESARLIGAQLSFDSSPGQGTRVRLRIPVS